MPSGRFPVFPCNGIRDDTGMRDRPISPAPPGAATPQDLVELGRVVSAYGVKGWIKIQPHSSQAEVLLAARTWWLAPRAVSPTPRASGPSGSAPSAGFAAPAAPRAVKVLAARPQGSTVVASLEGMADREQAEAMRGQGVYVSRSDFPPLEPGEYYWVDLIGCLVYGEDGAEPVLLGRVSEVADNGAHALLKVQRLAMDPVQPDPRPVLTAKGQQQEILVPFVDAHLLSVDVAGRRIDTNWPLDYD